MLKKRMVNCAAPFKCKSADFADLRSDPLRQVRLLQPASGNANDRLMFFDIVGDDIMPVDD
jgi:hypothetical protein